MALERTASDSPPRRVQAIRATGDGDSHCGSLARALLDHVRKRMPQPSAIDVRLYPQRQALEMENAPQEVGAFETHSNRAHSASKYAQRDDRYMVLKFVFSKTSPMMPRIR